MRGLLSIPIVIAAATIAAPVAAKDLPTSCGAADVPRPQHASAITMADQVILDQTTGVRLMLPHQLLSKPVLKSWGCTWDDPKGKFSIDTINFGITESIDSWHRRLVRKYGKAIKKNERKPDRFLVEGIVGEGTKSAYFIHVQGNVRNNEVRGISITMSESEGKKLYPIVEQVVNSFQPFPEQVVIATPVSPPPVVVQKPKDKVASIPKQEPKPDQKLEAPVESALIDSVQKQIGDLISRFQALEKESHLQKKNEQAQKETQAKLEAELVRLREQLDNERKATAASTGASFTGDRVALVIGNNSYPNLLPDMQLKRAVNDAREVARVLERLGFRVTRGENLSRLDMVQSLDDFAKSVRSGDMALVFFSGHGVAIAGGNYLLPSDVMPLQPDNFAKARAMAIAEADIIAELQQRDAKVTLLILDACRDNPLRLPGLTKKTIGNAKGLTLMPQARGVFVIYSAGFNESALEDLGPADEAKNSVFTRVFVRMLEQTDLSIADIAYKVKEIVPEISKCVCHPQNPAFYDQIVGGGRRIYLAGRPISSPPTGGATVCPGGKPPPVCS